MVLKQEYSSLLEEESMLQKFKITSCAFILCLFGLTLITVTPVFAYDIKPGLKECNSMGKKKGAKYPYKPRMNCFRDLLVTVRGMKANQRMQKRSAQQYRSETESGVRDKNGAVRDGYCISRKKNFQIVRGPRESQYGSTYCQ